MTTTNTTAALSAHQIEGINETVAEELVELLDLNDWADYWETTGTGKIEAFFTHQGRLFSVTTPVDFQATTVADLEADLFSRFQAEVEELDREWEALKYERSDAQEQQHYFI
jgi:hypothetical protein